MGRDALGVEELEHATVGPSDAADVKPARDNQLVELDYVRGSEVAASCWCEPVLDTHVVLVDGRHDS
jgi:hypothetical protein